MSNPQDFAHPDFDALANETAAVGAASDSAPSGAGAALAAHHDRLLAMTGVVMVGEGADEIGGPAIVVGVLRPDQLASLPESLDGVPVRGSVIGPVDALIQPS